jgi:hypothetical protein
MGFFVDSNKSKQHQSISFENPTIIVIIIIIIMNGVRICCIIIIIIIFFYQFDFLEIISDIIRLCLLTKNLNPPKYYNIDLNEIFLFSKFFKIIGDLIITLIFAVDLLDTNCVYLLIHICQILTNVSAYHHLVSIMDLGV